MKMLELIAVTGHDLEAQIMSLSWKGVGIGSLLLVILVVAAAILKDKFPIINKGLFGGIIIAIVVPTLVLIGSTIYLNSISFTKGPVHWHADFEIWTCGNEIELQDPAGTLSNKIGTPTLHEHNDRRIHLEGVPVTPADASLGKFFNVIGGQITKTSLSVPLNSNGSIFEDNIDGDGKSSLYANLVTPNMIHESSNGRFLNVSNGSGCEDKESKVQVFLYRMKSATEYVQTKIKDPANLVIKGESQVPPGDCLIIEYDEVKDFTDKLCEQYGVRDQDKCADFGVAPNKRQVCEIKDITKYTEGDDA